MVMISCGVSAVTPVVTPANKTYTPKHIQYDSSTLLVLSKTWSRKKCTNCLHLCILRCCSLDGSLQGGVFQAVRKGGLRGLRCLLQHSQRGFILLACIQSIHLRE